MHVHRSRLWLCIAPAGRLPHTWGYGRAGTAHLIRLGPIRVFLDIDACYGRNR